MRAKKVQRRPVGSAGGSAHGPLAAAQAAIASGRYEEAVPLMARAVAADPKNTGLHVNLGALLQMIGRTADAERAFEYALRLDPNEFNALVGLGGVRSLQNRFDEAVKLFQTALALQPKEARAHLLLVGALSDVGRSEEAEQALRNAIKELPTLVSARSSLGVRLQQAGRFVEAQNQYEEALRIDPSHGLAFWGLVQGKKITDVDRPLVDALSRALSAHGAPLEDKINLHYAMGKALDDLNECEQAMAHFESAKKLALRSLRRDERYSESETQRRFDETIQTYSRSFFQGAKRMGHSSARPVFILGMMRGGTTLVEQIVSSHPSVAAGGEIEFWVHEDSAQASPGWIRTGLSTVADRSRRYLELPAFQRSNLPLLTDKMPHNFTVAGLIHVHFPNARIIHCRRNPIDTCLSIFATPFKNAPSFSFEKDSLVHYYRQYERLMAHWREVLPADRFLEIDYENVVSDREAETKRLVEFLGLPWDDSCLFPEKNEREVLTASVWQARQPVYRSSVARWKRYEPWLGPLAELIDLPHSSS